MAAKYVGKEVLKLSKKGLSLPLKSWINTELREFTLDTIYDLKHRNIFNNQQIDFILQSNNEKNGN